MQENSGYAVIIYFLFFFCDFSCLKYSQCPSDLKLADVTPAHKEI